MRASGTVCRLLVGAAALVFVRNASAQTVRFELDGEAPLTSAAWTFIQSGATSSFSAGLLRLQSSHGFAEWMLRAAPDKPAPTTGWLADAKPGRGWWVEARVQIATATNCILSGPGMWIDDGKSFVQLHIDATSARLSATQTRAFTLSGGGFHVYRVQNLGGRHFQLLIDGALALDDPALETQENGKALMFGDLGGCDATDATWDYVAYEAFGPGAAPGDEDSDGVANAGDNCALLANADQADADKDGVGDACDLCVHDPDNDLDNDGICADTDACPADARNDQDHDGVCDTMECAPFQLGTSQPAACPSICNCRPIGNDPIGGFGNLDNFGGTYGVGVGTGGMGGTGTSGSGTSGAAHSAGRGGATSSAGSVGTSGGGESSAAVPVSESAGCGCRAHGSPERSTGGWLTLVAVAAAVGSRRVHGRKAHARRRS